MANIREAKAFVNAWQNRGDEKQDTQSFWIQLLDKVYEDHSYDKHILFEQVADKVQGGANFKDAVINRFTDHAVLIEQKSMKYALDQPEPRFGTMVTPFEQAKHYDDLSAYKDKARWIITCNFKEFWIYDMTKTGKELYEPVAKLKLEDMPEHLEWLSMIVAKEDSKVEFIDEVAVSKEAGELVGVMYDALKKRYPDPDSPETAKELNKLCVRIVFCLYAEDAGLFDKNNRKVFHDYLNRFDSRQIRKALIDLFRVLNQKEDERDVFLADDDPILASFPYVNGGLFKDDVMIPPFDDEIRELLLVKESMGFDWSKISPTIFGAVFESTLNPETRRSGGMHYTSIENIHKVIDPLFLDSLKTELDEILNLKTANIRTRRLKEFQNKIASLKFMDPAAGSGNFLTETFLCLRRLENEVIKALLGNRRMALGLEFDEDDLNAIKVKISQFYGIEINDFAVAVARTALWIAEAQMFEETQRILSSNKEFLPLQEFNNIVEGNALRIPWHTVLDPRDCSYVMGNPPFVGFRWQTEAQKEDLDEALNKRFKHGKLDYVTGWFIKGLDYIQSTHIECAFVSTNSITQGEHVAVFWNYALTNFPVHINFAYKTFVWKSEATDQANVHCVIIGFSELDRKDKYIFEDGAKTKVDFISPYLTEVAPIVVSKQVKPLSNVLPLVPGCQESGNGNLLFTPDEKDELVSKEPQSEAFFKYFMMGKEFLNGIERYCLWIPNIPLIEIKKNHPLVMNRLQKVSEFRKQSTNKQIREKASIPQRFDQYRPPAPRYIAFPRVSSQRRVYLPIGYLTDEVIPGDKLFTIPNGDLYMFGVLSSIIHAAWLRVMGGRLKSDYSYSSAMVYNTFIWPNSTEKQKLTISNCAEGILNARKLYSNYTLAEMYDPEVMPLELIKAHQQTDRAVMEAYGFRKDMTEAEIVAELMKLYQEKVNNL